MKGGHHQSDEEMIGMEHSPRSHFHPISPATPSQQRCWETGKRSTLSSHSLPTAHLQQNTATYPNTHGDSVGTPDRVSQVPRDSSFFTSFTPNDRALRAPPISQETSETGLETDSASALSRDSPFLPTFLMQPSTQKHHNASQDSWYRSTFYLRPSEDTESHASDSSYHLSRRSSTYSNIDVIDLVDTVEAIDAMDVTGTDNLSNAPKEGAADISYMDLTQDTGPAATGGAATQGAATPNGNSALHQMQFDGAATQGTINTRGGGTARAGGRGRGASSARGRGQGTPRGRGGASRAAKRPRARRNADDSDREDDNDGAPKPSKKPKSDAPDPEGVYPVEIHRCKTSLRERLIAGVFEPQAVGMRVYNMKKAAAAAAQAPAKSRNAPREFLVPIDPRLNAMANHRLPNSADSIANTDNAADDTAPNPRIAYKTTPMHQLHFPEGLVLALKQNMIKWEGKQHSEGLVFVVVHQIDGDIADMHVFSTLRDATGDAIWMMINEHPEAFALPRDVDSEGVEIKCEKFERATSVLRDINARPNFVQVPVPAAPTGRGCGTEHASGSQYTGTLGGSSVAGFGGEDSLFVIKEENPGEPRPPRFASPRPDLNNRGELLLGEAPEPTYVFCGKFRIVSFGLKMEARRADGAVVKVSVHLKNLRRPAPPT
ncbi:hypothetical protein F5B21DRAFT_528022 [Xylaria acuta]|nr:hypothetical protein F5B21DRAFT_528022 [Xylaria acuta]